MKRRWFAVLGAFLLVGEATALVASGFPTRIARISVSLVLPVLVGLLFVLGGLNVQIGNVEWNQFAGAAYVFMGIWVGVSFPLLVLQDASLGDAGAIFAIAGIVGGLSMVFIGVDWIRGGRYTEISQYEAGPILPFTTRNRT